MRTSIPAARMLEQCWTFSVAGEALQVEECLLRIALRSQQLAVGVGRVRLEAAADLVCVTHVQQRIGARSHDRTCAERTGGVVWTALGGSSVRGACLGARA
eukprot:scaffold46325_cov78-Phaeocystis_antarctica.AAC.5